MSSIAAQRPPENAVPGDKRPARGQDTGTLGKALTVLDAIATCAEPPRFTDVLHMLDVPRGTLHRQISHLIQEGLVVANRDHGYELGPRLLQLAARAWSANSFRKIAEPHLQGLHALAGETVHLGVLSGNEVIYLDKVESRHQAVRMYSQIGNVSPAYCTGIGKAMLAALPDGEIERRVKGTVFERKTPATLTTAAALIAEIGAIRQTGIAFDREEHEPGIHCVAAAIVSEGADMIAGLSVTAPTFRLPMADLAGYADAVKAAAGAIAEDVRTGLGPRPRRL